MSSDPVRRDRPTRRQYMVRRVVALVVLTAVVGLVGFGTAQLVGALFGGGDAGADAEVTDGGAGGGAEVGSAAGVEVVPAGSTTGGAGDEPASAPQERAGPPSRENPATVLILGDSDAGTFGPYLQTLLDGTGIMRSELDYKVSSGLARPDFFDWPAEIDRVLPELDPEIVVVTFGGNDAQGLAERDGTFIIGDPVANEAEWTAEYQRRAGAVMDQLLAGDRTVVWVGIPNDDNPDVTARMAIQDRAAKAAAAERPEVIFVDTWTRFSGRDGGWAEFVIDPRDGLGKDVRASDGFHLNQTGAEILAIDIAQAIRDVLREQGADI
jgi:uncharacterized protein